MVLDFRSFGCLLSSLWLPCWARCSLRSPLNIGFEIYGFGFLSFWLPFVDSRPFGCLLSSLWLPCWAHCSFRSPLNIGFEIYGFGFLSFFGCFLSPFSATNLDVLPPLEVCGVTCDRSSVELWPTRYLKHLLFQAFPHHP